MRRGLEKGEGERESGEGRHGTVSAAFPQGTAQKIVGERTMMEGRPAAKRRAQRSYGRQVRPHRVPLREEDQESETCWSLSTGHGNKIEKWPTPAPGTGGERKRREARRVRERERASDPTDYRASAGRDNNRERHTRPKRLGGEKVREKKGIQAW